MIAKYLDLSTCYLRKETMSTLSSAPHGLNQRLGWPAMTIAPYWRGAFVTVPSEMTDDQLNALPSDLEEVLSYARLQDAALVRFDADGDDHLDLPTYDW